MLKVIISANSVEFNDAVCDFKVAYDNYLLNKAGIAKPIEEVKIKEDQSKSIALILSFLIIV